MSYADKQKETIVVCSVCSTSVLLTEKSYNDVIDGIEKSIITSILFRTSVCTRCESKLRKAKDIQLVMPERGCKIPIGTGMIMDWPPYRRISIFMRKYCKLYECNNSFIHTIENRHDILSDAGENINVYKFQYDTTIHLENSSIYEFFSKNTEQVLKKRRLS
jgi:hypothetical protein